MTCRFVAFKAILASLSRSQSHLWFAWYCAMRNSVSSAIVGRGRMDTSQLLKGVLDLAVLAVLRDGDGYGYDVLRRLRQGGLEEVADASVYGTLRRLYRAGYLTSYVVPSDEGPHRKYYGVNEAGRERMVESEKAYRSFAEAMDGILRNGVTA